MDLDDIYEMERRVFYANRPAFQLSRNHPLLESGKQISPEQLADCEFVTLYPPLSYGYHEYLEKCCEAYGFQPKIGKYVDSIAEQTLYSGYSDYVSLTFENSLHYNAAHTVPLPDAPEVNAVVLYRSDNTNPALTKFLEML